MLAQSVTKNILELFAMFVWAVWKEICNWTHAPLKSRQHLNIDWVLPFFEEFSKDKLSISSQSQSLHVPVRLSWSKPPPGHFMLNVDAGFDEVIGRYSVGAVIRDHDGIVCAASARGIRSPGFHPFC